MFKNRWQLDYVFLFVVGTLIINGNLSWLIIGNKIAAISIGIFMLLIFLDVTVLILPKTFPTLFWRRKRK